MAKTSNRDRSRHSSTDPASVSSPGQSAQRDPSRPKQAPPNWMISRLAFILLTASITSGVILFYAQARWLAVFMTAIVELPLVAAWVASGWLVGRALLRLIPRISSTHPALRFATDAAVGLGIIGLAALGLGLAGLLNRWTVLAVLLIGPALHAPKLLALLRTNRQMPLNDWFARPMGARWLFLAAVPALGIMITGASICPGWLWKPSDPHPYDVTEYHLQVPREWFETGKITGLHHNVYSYFPFAVEMHYLMAMHLRGGPWAAMYQCQYFSIAWLILAAIAVYGISMDLLRSRTPTGPPTESDPPAWQTLLASSAAVFVLMTPWSMMLGAVAYTESALMLYTGLAIAWALLAARNVEFSCDPETPNPRPSPRIYPWVPRILNRLLRRLTSPTDAITAPLLVSGILAGLACGVKYTAFPMVLLAIPAVLFLFALATFSLRRWLIPLLLFLVIGSAIASPWLIRNWIWTGNPVFPLALKQLGPGHFDPVQVDRFIQAHGPTEQLRPIPARIARAFTAIFADWQFGCILWPLAAIALALACRRRSTWILTGLLLFVLIVWFFFTHLLGRFYVLTIPAAAILIAQVPARWWATTAATATVIAATIGFALIHQQLDPLATKARYGLFGLDDPAWLTPPELQDIYKPGVTVWMVGDAQSFLYSVPTARMKYRTVFDIPGNAKDIYQAWLGKPLSQTTGLIAIQPVEVQRLSKTYKNVPSLPPDYPYSRTEPTVIRH